MGVFLKSKDKERQAQCPYCYDGEIVLDLDTGRLVCEVCKWAIKIPVTNPNNISKKPQIKYIKNNVALMREI